MSSASTFTLGDTEVSETDLVLDLGTKDGTQLSDCPGTIVGLDIDDSRFIHENKTKFVLGDGRRLPFASGVFDYVYCAVVLEHVNGTDALISETARVLKSSGEAMFSFPNRISLLQPHEEIPRYYSLLPKPIGRFLAPHVLTDRQTEYYENALFPLTTVTARRHLHESFGDVEYTMEMSGEMITENPRLRRAIRAGNRVVTQPPFKWPYELLWPNATYRCTGPKKSEAVVSG